MNIKRDIANEYSKLYIFIYCLSGFPFGAILNYFDVRVGSKMNSDFPYAD